ncbi:MAG: trypsin-like peptidase domain-containing protein [Brevundimonas sp.]|uniref:trypsin-like peptidase domain-containing protein n=1 Tax=Brevundimonas sp. TaxID=1871086 RepID=UPI002569BCE9|nr:trypsin-like peptidase domain-containing protein [Brevundimonas sp.]MDK2749011.1 trypsin-like peptidase domain-containing protein [Brevundimonas sp.]
MRLTLASAASFWTLASAALAQADPQGLAVQGPAMTPQVALPNSPLILGVQMQSEEIPAYQGTWFAEAGQPVGYLEVIARGPLTMGPQTIPCTAWLVGPDVIMTAWHCLPGLPRATREAGFRYVSATVTFQFDEIGATGARYTVGQVLEANPDLDYTLARLLPIAANAPAPGERLGVIRVARGGGAAPGTPLFMIHHAYGHSKLLLKDASCRVFDQPSGLDIYLYHRCDTRGGSSGAPVLLYGEAEGEAAGVRNFIAVGLHSSGTPGGLANPNDVNIAVSLSAIIEASAYLSAVACEPDAYRPYCKDIKSVAPAPNLVFFDWDRTDLTAEAQLLVRALADRIKADPTVTRVLIVGHGDPRDGTASYTLGVSNRRARTVADALVAMGVNGALVSLEGKGVTQPMVAGLLTPDPLNRRAEIVLERRPPPAPVSF